MIGSLTRSRALPLQCAALAIFSAVSSTHPTALRPDRYMRLIINALGDETATRSESRLTLAPALRMLNGYDQLEDKEHTANINAALYLTTCCTAGELWGHCAGRV
jgi:hypothetical protein